jgi:DNA repair protein RadC
MSEIGRLLGIPVLDHLVVTRTTTVSLAELGVLEPRPAG